MKTRSVAICAALVCATGSASAQLRVAQWNVTNYSGGRIADFQTAIYGVFNGRSMAPDVLLGEEFISQAGVDTFLTLLNGAPGSPGDWAASPFIDGPDTDCAFFWRTSKIDFLGVTIAATADGTSGQPRNTYRYDIRLRGYTSPGATIACYASHMKAGSASADQSRRLVEAQRIRANAETLPAGWHFLLGGDFNIQSSSQAAYATLVGSLESDTGRLFDPIATPGNWNNNSGFRFVHTQDPIGAGGMDDRHDQLLVSASLIDGDGLDYIGDPAIPYSTMTWDDPNHSYRSWGNDGTSFDAALTVAGNTMVGPAIAQALRNAANGGGHLPVFLDLRVPAAIASESAIDFGAVDQGAVAVATLHVSDAGDVALWSAAGIDDLRYTLGEPARFSVAAGPFVAAAGGAPNDHLVIMDTSVAGPVSGTLLIGSNAPDEPMRAVMLTGFVRGGCPADLDGDGAVSSADLAIVLGSWGGSGGAADLDGSGAVGAGDLAVVLGSWGQCP